VNFETETCLADFEFNRSYCKNLVVKQDFVDTIGKAKIYEIEKVDNYVCMPLEGYKEVILTLRRYLVYENDHDL
jgi:hypothetical protein